MRALSSVSLAASLALVAFGSGCVDDQGNPSVVNDLRVLGLSFESPEILAPSCDFEAPENFAAIASTVQFRALISDPQGGGRELEYELRACSRSADVNANPDQVSETTCEPGAETVTLASGITTEGELELTVAPGTTQLQDGTFLLQKVLENDRYGGLGGARMPLVLRVKGGDEEIYAEKLMVYSCRFFPEMQQNVTPVLPGVRFAGEAWGPDEIREVSGLGPFLIQPDDFAALEEDYIVPTFELKPLALKESWKISWFATEGEMSPTVSGGTALDGVKSPPNSEWEIPDDKIPAGPTEVKFWAVVRDGRGGVSWISRRVRWTGP